MATIPAAPEFDFEELLATAVQRQATLADGESDDGGGEGDDDGGESDLSPLSSPPQSPGRSTTSLPTETSAASTTMDSMGGNQTPGEPGMRLKRNKRQGHANRRRKRQAVSSQEGPDLYKPRPNSSKKHVSTALEVKTGFESKDIPIAKTGYVGIRQTASSTTYRLAELVGPRSRFKLHLYEWDGR